MIDNETLLGFALNALEPAEQEAVRLRLEADADAARNLARIQKLLAPLAADREPPKPAIDLTRATLTRLDASQARPRAGAGSVRRWVEFAVAAGIGVLGFGLVASGVSKFQADNQRMACANNLRTLSAGLNSYADSHNNRLPQVGVADAPTAGDFHTILQQGRHWPPGLTPTCTPAHPVSYMYSLGYRDAGGNLVGHTRNPDTATRLPIASDFPGRGFKADGPVSPHGRGQNVLFVDGKVNFLNTAALNSDHLFLNDQGRARAGLHAADNVLGHPGDVP